MWNLNQFKHQETTLRPLTFSLFLIFSADKNLLVLIKGHLFQLSEPQTTSFGNCDKAIRRFSVSTVSIGVQKNFTSQKLDSLIQRISVRETNSTIQWIVIYLVDSTVLSTFWTRYPRLPFLDLRFCLLFLNFPSILTVSIKRLPLGTLCVSSSWYMYVKQQRRRRLRKRSLDQVPNWGKRRKKSAWAKKESTSETSGEAVWGGGGHWWGGGVPNTAIPYEKLVNTEIPCRKWTKHRYRIYDRWRLLNVVPISRVFFFYLSLYTPEMNLSLHEKTWEDLELIGTKIEKPGHWMSYQFYHRVTVRNCVFIYRWV